MKIIRVGRYTLMRHWGRWYWVHQMFGGSEVEQNRTERIVFAKKEIE